ncbi:MAG: hypothetical protein BWK72_01910 [Rhodoferax ferrireducens]|uniref:ABC-type transport auxiliary lipoprotein component domain-containing protein n=1 Tax=Rhodoferax ferrireducens TaxID=192843 RepID=A0A1W9KZ45_9BURK|nr:MAG: hypothetical protein BWK72_01910 [Rhodoferax ferrireducens]
MRLMNLSLLKNHLVTSAAQRLKPALGRCLVALTLTTLAACASRAPEPTLYLLRSDPPPGVQVPASVSHVASDARHAWQLMLPVRVPAYLDRTALLLPQGANGVQPSSTRRWAEPLANSVPRVLAQDLNALLGEGAVWTSPLPPSVVVQGQLRVELLAFDVAANGEAVTLKARWTTAGATAAARQHLRSFTVPSATPETDGLVGAHRLALWQLAQAIAATLE